MIFPADISCIIKKLDFVGGVGYSIQVTKKKLSASHLCSRVADMGRYVEHYTFDVCLRADTFCIRFYLFRRYADIFGTAEF